MGVGGVLIFAAGDVAAVEIEFGAVGKRVFDGVAIEVLVDVVAAIMPAANGFGLHRPGVFHPAGSSTLWTNESL